MTFFVLTIFTHLSIVVDFQALIFISCILISQLFILIEMIEVSVFFFGLSLNCSLDALLIMPVYIIFVIKKLMKRLYTSRNLPHRHHNLLYRDNNLDLDLLRHLLQDLLQTFQIFVVGWMLPWFPFIYKVGFSKSIGHGLNPFNDKIVSSIYGGSVVNPNSWWCSRVLGFSEKQLQTIEVPLIGQLIFSFFINFCMSKVVSVFSNPVHPSRSRDFLNTLLLTFAVNFFIGNPKLQSVDGVFVLMCLLAIMLFTDGLSIILILSATSVMIFNQTNYNIFPW